VNRLPVAHLIAQAFNRGSVR